MGWSRYCHGTRMSTRDPGLALLQATSPSLALARRVARRLAAAGPLPSAAAAAIAGNVTAERAIFNEETWLPAHGEYVAAGTSLRCVPRGCARVCVCVCASVCCAAMIRTLIPFCAALLFGRRVMNFFCFANSKTLLRFMHRENDMKCVVTARARAVLPRVPASY
jgi:hypothetical protein